MSFLYLIRHKEEFKQMADEMNISPSLLAELCMNLGQAIKTLALEPEEEGS